MGKIVQGMAVSILECAPYLSEVETTWMIQKSIILYLHSEINGDYGIVTPRTPKARR
jgi:hypothetical protein